MPEKSIDVLTTTVYPEMREHAEWLIDKQDYEGPTRHLIATGPPVGGRTARYGLQTELLKKSDADLFMFADDDDYLPSWFIRRCVSELRDGDVYGMIPDSIYFLRARAYGDGTKRDRLFITFTIYQGRVRESVLRAMESSDPPAAMSRILAAHTHPPISPNLIIMRGMMDDPSLAITARKNRLDRKVFPRDDPYLVKLEEFSGKDVGVYRKFAEERGW